MVTLFIFVEDCMCDLYIPCVAEHIPEMLGPIHGRCMGDIFFLLEIFMDDATFVCVEDYVCQFKSLLFTPLSPYYTWCCGGRSMRVVLMSTLVLSRSVLVFLSPIAHTSGWCYRVALASWAHGSGPVYLRCEIWR